MTRAKKLEILWNFPKKKILLIKKAKKIFSNGKKREKKVLIDIYFNQKIV